MLKLQSKDTGKSFWLVDPVMRIGAASDSEILLTGDGVHDLHAKILSEGDKLFLEPVTGAQTYLNEQQATLKSPLPVGTILRVGVHEFAIVDPSQKTANPFAEGKKTAQPVSDDATLFRPKKQAASNTGSGWFIQAMHKSLQNKRYPLEGIMSVGRSKDCELSFSFDRLSRKHAQFELLDGVLFIKDLQSSNGVFHNGKKVTQAKLSHGDTVAFDKLEFTVVNTNQAETPKMAQEEGLNETVMGGVAPASSQAVKGAEPKAAGTSSGTNKSGTQQKKGGMVPLLVAGLSLLVFIGVAAYFVLK